MYFFGHWGWQHYSQAAGMIAFNAPTAQLIPGDTIVIPRNVDRQFIPMWLLGRCRELGTETASARGWLPRTRDRHAIVFFYGNTRQGRIPWGWATDDHPQELFLILRCDRY